MNTFFMAGMIAFLFSGGILNASNAELFNYNKDKVNEDLKELMILEDYLHQHPSITLTQLISHKNTAFPDEHLLSLAASIHFAAEPPLGIPSFLWGCMFGVSGVAIVYYSGG